MNMNIQNRAQIVDTQFLEKVRQESQENLPSLDHPFSPHSVGLTREMVLDLFESQVICRHLDIQARVLKAQNESFYTIGSAGHEGNAVAGMVFRYTDMSFLHYRSGAFMVQRSKQLAGSTPLYDGLLSLVASSEDPIAGGRHKVFGSLPLWVPPQTSTIASHLPKALGAALSIPKAKSLQIPTPLPLDSLILCSFGDASVNHSTAQGAFNSAAWCAFQNIPLPLVFLCEDNGIGISVPTPSNWIEQSLSQRPGIKYFQCNGLDLLDTYLVCLQVEHYVRTLQRPAFLHMKTIRLLGHAGADIESTYHSLQQIEESERHDPLLYSAGMILRYSYLKAEQIIDLYESIRERVQRISQEAVNRSKLQTIQQVESTIVPPIQYHLRPKPRPSEESRKEIFGHEYSQFKTPTHMAKLINWALHDLMLQYPEILVFGEDVAKKGGVYYVTVNLMKKFGEKRVFNTLLDEQTIIGTGLGLAHNGLLPIPEIQFLAYLHNAEDQLRGEAATLSFFSQGQFTNPCVLRVPGLAYQKGFGGHFHNDNSLAVLRDIPGIVIACPSNGADAARMLRSCVRISYEERRVVVFIEPIALYMTKDLHDKGDSGWSFPYPDVQEEIPVGKFGVYEEFSPSLSTVSSSSPAQTLTILTYGNGYYYSRQAARLLTQETSLKIKILDLRWISPLDEKGILKEIGPSEHVLIVEECRKTGSLSEALVALITTGLSAVSHPLPKIKVLAAADCFIPLGVAYAEGLPQTPEILKAAKELLQATPAFSSVSLIEGEKRLILS